jgi:hypothetical protein
MERTVTQHTVDGEYCNKGGADLETLVAAVKLLSTQRKEEDLAPFRRLRREQLLDASKRRTRPPFADFERFKAWFRGYCGTACAGRVAGFVDVDGHLYIFPPRGGVLYEGAAHSATLHVRMSGRLRSSLDPLGVTGAFLPRRAACVARIALTRPIVT